MHTGFCGMGCPTNAKRGMALTYLPDAADRGARVYADCRAVRLVLDARSERVTAVEAEVLDPATDRPTGRRVTVTAARFVVAGGAINSPALLLRSAVPDPHARIGRRTFLHPVVATIGIFEKRVDPFYGAPQSVASHAFIERPGKTGFFLEVAPLHPMLASMALPDFGASHRDGMKLLSRTSAVIALLRDGFLPEDEGGTVSLRENGQRLSIRYPLAETHREAMREAMKVSARIQLAAGAREVRTLHRDPVVVREERDLARDRHEGHGTEHGAASSRPTRWGAARPARTRGSPSWTETCATTTSRTSGSSTGRSSRPPSASIPSSRSSASSRRRSNG